MDDTDSVYTLERPAGADRLIAAFINRDSGGQVDVEALMTYAAGDAVRRAPQGWRLWSLGALPIRQLGTAGNVLFQSGGGYETQVALVAVYGREPSGPR